MNLPATIQGRHITLETVVWIQELMKANPNWNRSRLSREVCSVWNWTADNGALKDMACRSLLLKLDRLEYIKLPKAMNAGGGNHFKNQTPIAHSTSEISEFLHNLTPLSIEIAQDGVPLLLFKHLLSQYHYLGFNGAVGENMKYLIYDRKSRPVACLLFGSAAWKTAPRDEFIGWNASIRQAHLSFITNNMRFLILPWVKVPHLASHILSRISRRLSHDWLQKYSHPIYMLETFVEQERFRGTCYKAANWIHVGQTQGRSRNDRYAKLQVPIKDVYVYPLTPRFREELK